MKFVPNCSIENLASSRHRRQTLRVVANMWIDPGVA